MSKIAISDLQPAGFGLFSDSESYLKELSEEELCIQGGFWRTLLSYAGSAIWDAISYVAEQIV
jgi:hypothetical protein